MVLYFAGRLSAFRQSGILVPRFSRKRERDARARNRGDRSPRASLLAAMCSSTHGAVAKRLCGGLQSRSGRFDSGSRLQDYSDAGIRLASLLEPSGCVRQSSATSTCVDVCRRVSACAARRLLFAMHFPIDRLSGLGRSGARARTSRAARSHRHPVDIRIRASSNAFCRMRCGRRFRGGERGGDVGASRHRALPRAPTAAPVSEGAARPAGRRRRGAPVSRASRAQAGVTSARSK